MGGAVSEFVISSSMRWMTLVANRIVVEYEQLVMAAMAQIRRTPIKLGW